VENVHYLTIANFQLLSLLWTVGMLMDIQINPDNKLSENIWIINYPFNYPSIWRLTLFMYFLCSFSKFLHYFTKILNINTSISKILAAGL